jgi:citrate lyase beta subunit
MRHFAYLTDAERDRLFVRPSEALRFDGPRETIALALGATLYCPATRSHLDRDAARAAGAGATSMVWCLEDAIPDGAVAAAEDNVVATLERMHREGADDGDRQPFLFVRVRSAEQVRRIAARAGDALGRLTGFSLPKIGSVNGRAMLDAVRDVSDGLGRPLYAMPILETTEIGYVETRRACLRDLAELFADYPEHVLCVRIGGTDLAGIFGLRRDRDTTIWDVAVVRDAVADILNQFAREGRHVVTGAVWEHIPGPRLFKPSLRQSPFHNQHEGSLRQRLISEDVDALIREVSLDKNNGIYGKTVIHPTHVSIVNSLLCVTQGEYDDARAIARTRESGGGVTASPYGRMNESGPHSLWADQIVARAAIYGVVTDDAALIELLAIGQRVVEETWGSSVAPFRVVS